MALASLLVANVQFVQRAITTAFAGRAALLLVGTEAIVAVLANVTLASGHVLLARTNDAVDELELFAAARELWQNSVGVASTLLADRVVEEIGRALGALVTDEVGLAFALAGVGVARGANGAGTVAFAWIALGKAVTKES